MRSLSILCSILMLLTILSNVEVSKSQTCRPTGLFRGNSPPAEQCSSDCCVQNKVYFTFQCSPTVRNQTPGILTFRTFQNRSGINPSKCDNMYRSHSTPVVALSTGWYNGGSRCGKMALITGNGKSVKVKVVDECDSTKRCDAQEGYHPPCGYNVVAASTVVWNALGVSVSQSGNLSIVWADA